MHAMEQSLFSLRTPPFLALLLFVLVMAGCAGDEPAPEPDAAMQQDTATMADSAPMASSVVIDDPVSAPIVTARLYEWELELSRDTVPAGRVTFRIWNVGSTVHAFEIEGESLEEETSRIAPGRNALLTVDLEPGTYEVYCPVVTNGIEHQERGMTATFVVQG